MTSSSSNSRLGEFELIHALFAPLARALPGALGLNDDVAVLSVPAGDEIVLKSDAVVEGVHFHTSDPPELIAKKALRVNISDFAAKGVRPQAYLLVLALPQWPDMAWLERFAAGLNEDQVEFGVVLAGGDTVGTPGALTIAVMMTGFVPHGALIRREGAAPGDVVYVTGTIGDAGGGLALLKAEAANRAGWETTLISRYHLPRPRLAFGHMLRGFASASLDVSDGLVADLSHIAGASRVRIEIVAGRVPLSPELQMFYGEDNSAVIRAASAGDDYEIAFTAAPIHRNSVEKIAARTNTRVTEIGRVVPGEGAALVDAEGNEIAIARKGYTHF